MIRRVLNYYLPSFEQETGVPVKVYDDIEFFVDLLAATEITAVLIAEDYECSREEAYHISWISQPFGEREYNYDKPCKPLASLYKELSKEIIQELRLEAGEEALPKGAEEVKFMQSTLR